MEALRRPTPREQAIVLVLDDEESVGAFVRAALPEGQYRTLWCPSVASALAAVDDEQPDLALVDIGLGGDGGGGWTFLKHLRSHTATESLPVVMLTGSSDTMNRQKSLSLGADRYLIKPVRPETLRRVINEMLSARDDIWWSLTMRSEQVDRVRELFFDPTTELPTLAIVVDQLRRSVEQGEVLQVFCLEIEPLFRLGEREMWDTFDELRREFVRGLRIMVAPLLGNDVVIATSHSGANDFYCFTRNGKGNQSQLVKDLERVSRNALRSIRVDPALAEEVTIFCGGSLTQPQPVYPPRILYNAVREAKDNAERRETRYYHALRERLTRAVQERTITTVFQPIVDLKTFAVCGYEALSRGPAGTEIENPEIIFELARDFDLVWELEKLCIENVKPTLADVCSRGFLFFNLESHFIQQLQQRGTEIFESFVDCHHQVVIEVTERSAIRDYRTFRRTLHELKQMGFRIAIDDCGSGYATLEAVAELQPDYLKVGHSLFHGVEKDPIRRRLVDLVARCADTIGAQTIAEAIETEDQLRICRDLGVQLGQGYLFAAPAPWETISGWRPPVA
ncbi:MAG TPA: EAL domain-containing protein [Thermoanaerobaculia bacterium]|jgi:EAL domain-containing protein (putative c-di-GMP-specific phosphodiesterase class I)/DNA-binding response OmpR family regulator|nr:EAL domain-containing protein [Thermoanaerobaculia bacterium]